MLKIYFYLLIAFNLQHPGLIEIPPEIYGPVIHQINIELNLLDSNEPLFKPVPLSQELQWTRSWIRHAIDDDFPDISMGKIFPDRQYVEACLATNRIQFNYLLDCRDGSSRYEDYKYYDRAISESQKRYEIWQMVLESQDMRQWLVIRRCNLAALRKTIGSKDFYEGRLPPYVLLECMRKVK